ncbi:Gag polyprotein [Trichinella sp. T6]|nr:Gag polyprotein [Trichinella sp. T6]
MEPQGATERRVRVDSGGPAQTLNPSDPQRLTGLVEFLMFSHQPTWDDFQQMLQPNPN